MIHNQQKIMNIKKRTAISSPFFNRQRPDKTGYSMVVYCPPIEKVSCLFHLVCILHTQNILLDDILHLRPVVPGDDTYISVHITLFL